MKNFFEFVKQKAFSSNDLTGVAVLATGAFVFGFLMGVIFRYPLLGTSVFFVALWGYIYAIYRTQK